MNHAFILVLGLMHAGFLIAISLRLRHLGFTGAMIVKLVAFSLIIWPITLFLGAITDIEPLWAWGGLPPTIFITLMIYFGIEFKVSTETTSTRDQRLSAQREEDAQHSAVVENEKSILATYQAVKTYVGEDQNLVVISDLGKLKSARIHCKIEGAVVKTLYVKESDVDSVAKLIDVDVSLIDNDQSN